MNVAIVGAGMAGLSCAEALLDRGHAVTLFDKGRHPGGRMSTKVLPTPSGDAGFDYGAQYMTARDSAFRARVARWREAGDVAPWPAAGPDAWVGTPGMSAPVIDMAGRCDVRWSARVAALRQDDGIWWLRGERLESGPYDAVVLAIPAEQVGPLVSDHDAGMAALAAATPSQPCWTVMAAFAEALRIEADIVKDRGAVAWAARNSAKPGRSGPEAWVIQASPGWSAEHLADDHAAVATELLAAFADEVGVGFPKALTTEAHLWRFARSGRTDVGCVWNGGRKLALCGDWLIGPKVEAAWLSGAALADAIDGCASQRATPQMSSPESGMSRSAAAASSVPAPLAKRFDALRLMASRTDRTKYGAAIDSPACSSIVALPRSSLLGRGEPRYASGCRSSRSPLASSARI